MDEKGFVEGMREYIAQLNREKRYSSAKSYQDALNSFIRYSGTDCIAYSAINKDNLRRYEAYLLENGCMRNTISTYMRRLRCIYNKRWRTVRRNLFPLYSRGFLRVWKVSVRSPCLSRIYTVWWQSRWRMGNREDTVGALLDVSVWGYVFRWLCPLEDR